MRSSSSVHNIFIKEVDLISKNILCIILRLCSVELCFCVNFALSTCNVFSCHHFFMYNLCVLLSSLLWLKVVYTFFLKSMTTNKLFFSPHCNDSKWGVLLSSLLCTNDVLFYPQCHEYKACVLLSTQLWVQVLCSLFLYM